jgi:hypothetical protein
MALGLTFILAISKSSETMFNKASSSTKNSSLGQAIIPFSVLSVISETSPSEQEDDRFSKETGKCEVLEDAESAPSLNISLAPVEQSDPFTMLSEWPSYAIDDPLEREL